MDDSDFKKIVQEEWEQVPSPYKEQITNVALLIEDASGDDDALLGIYQGVPLTERGEGYGIGPTLPDTITIYRNTTMLEAEELLKGIGGELRDHVRKVVRDTIWHELGHYFGHVDEHIYMRENEGTNEFRPS